MHKITKRISVIFTVIFTLLLLAVPSLPVQAADVSFTSYSGTADSGYRMIVQDEAELLSGATDAELAALYSLLGEIADACNVAFYSTNSNSYYSTSSLAQHKNEEFFGSGSSSILFVIDMDERVIYLDSMGSMKKYITKANAETITDNTYRYASRADYYGCAYEAFSEVNALLKGRHIARPMKYISNALLAVILAMLINFFAVKITTAKHAPNTSELLSGMYQGFTVHEPKTTFLNQTKRYSPQSSGGSGGGGGGGHSGGGGGGGHSGGGHRF